jgi:hypothetical protein
MASVKLRAYVSQQLSVSTHFHVITFLKQRRHALKHFAAD